MIAALEAQMASFWELRVKEAEELRDLVDDLCDRLERSGVNDTGLPDSYMRSELRAVRSRSRDLIEDLYDEAFQAAETVKTE